MCRLEHLVDAPPQPSTYNTPHLPGCLSLFPPSPSHSVHSGNIPVFPLRISGLSLAQRVLNTWQGPASPSYNNVPSHGLSHTQPLHEKEPRDSNMSLSAQHDSSSRVSNVLVWPPWTCACMQCTNSHRHTDHIYISNKYTVFTIYT